MLDSRTTDFGYQQVPIAEKANRVAAVFDSVAHSYDLMNDLMSIGIHRLWKRFTVALSGVRVGHKVLDIAGGTGDLARLFLDKVGLKGQVCLADINAAMLTLGRDRLINQGYFKNIHCIQTDAEALPFRANNFDTVSIAFGLRNVTNKAAALKSMYHVLKPGGSLLVLEFSKPVLLWLRKAYDHYSFTLLPKLGEWIVGDAPSYQYLAESIRMHPDQETLKQLIMAAGFDRCEYYNLTGGIVALHRAYKF